MPATASKARGDRLSVGAMKLPAALLTSPLNHAGGPQRLDHVFDRGRIAYVDTEGVDAPVRVRGTPGGRGVVAHRFAPAADGHVGAQLQEALGHRLAQPGAAAGDQNALASHEFRVEHAVSPVVWGRSSYQGRVRRKPASTSSTSPVVFCAPAAQPPRGLGHVVGADHRIERGSRLVSLDRGSVAFGAEAALHPRRFHQARRNAVDADLGPERASKPCRHGVEGAPWTPCRRSTSRCP